MTGAFCTKCGARAAQPSSPQPASPPPAPPSPPPAYTAPPPPPPQQPYTPPQQAYAPPQQQYVPQQQLAPAASSGSGLKILFVVLGVFAVLGMLFFGALWYGWHKVKQTAAAKGIDLNSFSETQRGPGRRLDACKLLPQEEVAQILGMKVDRVEGNGRSTSSKCTYFSEAAPDHAVNAAGEAMRELGSRDASSKPEDQEEAMRQLGTIVRSFGGAAANGQVLAIEIQTENAKSVMAAFKIAMGVMTAGMEKEKVPGMREDIKGLGDEALMGPLASIFMFRKGDVAVSIDGRTLTGGRDTEIEIAKRIIARL